jgi:polysaccharide export outer membrane protein
MTDRRRSLILPFVRLTVALPLCIALLAASLAHPVAAIADTPIHAGDKLQLTVFNHPDLTAEVTVTSDGYVPVPLAGQVSVEGLTETLAGNRIGSSLTRYLRHPAVSVRILQQGQSIFFTGSLLGVQPYQPGETLGTAIGAFTAKAQAGAQGMPAARTDTIDMRRVRVQRGKNVTDPIDLEALARSGDSGPRLQPGDTILLATKPIRVDVRGDVKSPATVYLYPGESLNQAVNGAGGFQATTSLAKIGLKRDGADSEVSAAGAEFSGPAHDGDIVTLHPAPHVSVLGAVEKPGDTTLQVGSTLLSALYSAGGPNKFADLKHIKIMHDGASQSFNLARLTHGDLSQDMPIRDGDVIFVPQGHQIDTNLIFQALGALTPFRFFLPGVLR